MSLAVDTTVGARFACVSCRTRQASEVCARCGRRTVDLATPAGASTLGALCASHHVPRKRAPFADPWARFASVFVWCCALLGAIAVARWSRKIDTRGFIPKHALLALAALGGLIVGRIGAALVAVGAQVAAAALGMFAWGAGSLALAGSRPDANGRARGWQRAMLVLRGVGRNLAVSPFGGTRREVAPDAPGPLLTPNAFAPIEGPADCEGVLIADELVAIDTWSGAIIAVEGRTHGTDVCDATLAPFSVRTHEGDEQRVRLDAGTVRFDEAPTDHAIVRGLPPAWGVRASHATAMPVNVWVAQSGARVRLRGGRLADDGTLIGDADAPLVLTVIASAPATSDVIDTATDEGTIAS